MLHFVCGVLATYGLVVACGNMKDDIREEIFASTETGGGNGEQSCLSKLYSKGDEEEEK